MKSPTRGLPACPARFQNDPIARATWDFLRMELAAIGNDFAADTVFLEGICCFCSRAIAAERSLKTCSDEARGVFEEVRNETWEMFREFAGEMLLALDVRVRLVKAIAPDLEIDFQQLITTNHGGTQ